MTIKHVSAIPATPSPLYSGERVGAQVLLRRVIATRPVQTAAACGFAPRLLPTLRSRKRRTHTISFSGRLLRTFLTALALATCIASSSRAQVRAPIQPGPTGGPPILRDVGIDNHEGDSVPPDLVFRDEAGQSVRLADYFGRRPIVLALVYYRCPGLCTMVLNDLTRAMNSLSENAGEQFDVLTISFDPDETPDLAAAKKNQYIRAYRRAGAEAGWHFLTGTRESIARLTTAVGFRYAWDAKNQQWAHCSGLMILTPDGKISRYFYGIDYAPTDLRLALAEAGAKKISPPLGTRVLLYCFHYDPSTGRYSLMVMRLVQVGGVITLLLLGGSMWLTARRDRKRAKRTSEL